MPDEPTVEKPAQTAVVPTGLTGKHVALIMGGVGLFMALGFVAFILENALKRNASTVTKTSSSQTTTTGNVSHDTLMTQSPSVQATYLGKIVGGGCVGTYAFFMGMAEDKNVFWSVRCSNGKSYQVMISPDADGNTKVLECDVLQRVTKIRCFEKIQG